MHTTQVNQSIIDVTLEEHGNLEALFDLASANGVSITSTPQPGTTLNSGSSLASDFAVAATVQQSGLGTALASNMGGIGYMSIEGTFKVS